MSDDELLQGYHGVPSQEELKALSYLEIFSRLSRAEDGSVKQMVYEREKWRRDSIESEKSTYLPTNNRRYKNPIWKIAIAILVAVIGGLGTNYLWRKFF